MFAIIDIETCGGKYEFRKGRLTEICILIHDCLRVVEKFTSLVNPECYISPYFINITGITNEMVENAPKFQEIAKKVIELTEDKIFVAHNVAFDYGFIRDEFLALGYKYKRETLCTVKLSRKLMPGKMSYSLGRLCDSLGIENNARHRAEGDAVATAKLFDMLLHAKSINPIYKNVGVAEIMTTRIDKMKQSILENLPEAVGVYYFRDKNKDIIYIGKSNNIYSRALSHFNTKESKGKKMLFELYHADAVETGSELIALLHESQEIKLHKPKFNHMRKADAFTHSIYWNIDSEGIINFSIKEYGQTKNTLVSFTSYTSARERLEQWIEEKYLCLQYCSLTGSGSICFNHQIKKCHGICCGLEEVEQYNHRANELLKDYIFQNKNFIIFDKGRTIEEKSIIMIENGHYAGYGYIDSTTQINSAEEMKNIIKQAVYYPDSNDIIRAWIKNNPKCKMVEI